MVYAWNYCHIVFVESDEMFNKAFVSDVLFNFASLQIATYVEYFKTVNCVFRTTNKINVLTINVSEYHYLQCNHKQKNAIIIAV